MTSQAATGARESHPIRPASGLSTRLPILNLCPVSCVCEVQDLGTGEEEGQCIPQKRSLSLPPELVHSGLKVKSEAALPPG
jgi:hypothetical protein